MKPNPIAHTLAAAMAILGFACSPPPGENARDGSAGAPAPQTPAATAGPVNETLGVPLVKVVDGKFQPFAYADGKEPKNYLLYVSAYW